MKVCSLRVAVQALMFSLAIHAAPLYSETYPVSIPSQFGEVVDYAPSSNKLSPLVILIQDAHVQYEAEKSIMEILRTLIQEQGLDLILVEGGSGDVDLSYLKEDISGEHAAQVADKYLKSGIISAEEYLDLTLDEYDIDLWGVEDADSYARNMKTFLNYQKYQRRAVAKLQDLANKINKLKKRYYPKSFRGIEQLKMKYADQRGDFSEYLNALKEASDHRGTKTADFKFFDAWQRLIQSEKAFDQSKYEFQKDRFMSGLAKVVSKADVEYIARLSHESGIEAEVKYLEELLQLKKSYETELKEYPADSIEMQLLLKRDILDIDIEKVLDDADRIYEAIKDQELKSNLLQKLARLSDYLVNLKKALRLEWTSKDAQFYEANMKARDIKSLLADFGEEAAWKDIKFYVKDMLLFYRAAEKREQGILKNTLHKIFESQSKISALILGGYHADRIFDELKERNIAVMSVMPRFNASLEGGESQRLKYYRMLKKKWDKGKSWQQSRAPS